MSQTDLLAEQFEIETPAAKTRHYSNICSALSNILFLAFAFWRIGEVIKHQFFLHANHVTLDSRT